MVIGNTRKLLSVAALLATAGMTCAKGRHAQPAPEDQIDVVAHIPSSGEEIVRFVTTQHYRRDYLYAEQEAGKSVTLIDVTNLKQPNVLSQMSAPAGTGDEMVVATGNAALMAVSNNSQPGSLAAPQTFRIMNFADPMHPAVQQEFKGVTAMARDDKRGLIFLANSDGIWILRQKFAEDPAYEKEWEHMMLDAR